MGQQLEEEKVYLNFCNSVRKEFIYSLIRTKRARSYSVKKLNKLEYAK